MPHERRLPCAREQVKVPLHRVGREIGIIDGIALRPVAEDQLTVPIVRRDPKPALPVIGGDGAISVPPLWIGGRPRIQDAHNAIGVSRAVQSIVEPLEKIRIRIWPDTQPNIGGRATVIANDIPAIEGRADAYHAIASLIRTISAS